MSIVRLPLTIDYDARYNPNSTNTSVDIQTTSALVNGMVDFNSTTKSSSVLRRPGFSMKYQGAQSNNAFLAGYKYVSTTDTHYSIVSPTAAGGLTNYLMVNGQVTAPANHTIGPALDIYSFIEDTDYIYFLGSDVTTTLGTESLWKFNKDNAGSVTQLTNAVEGIPLAQYTQGLVDLDGYLFLMTQEGRIYNSNVGNFDLWTSTDFITRDGNDRSVYLCKHHQYVLAFGTQSIQVFYNAGNPNGSPLSVRKDIRVPFGVIAEESTDGAGDYSALSYAIDNDDQYVVFLAQAGVRDNTSNLASTNHNGLYLIDKLAVRKISTKAIDITISEAADGSNSLGKTSVNIFSAFGRKFVAVTLFVTGVSVGGGAPNNMLIYDIENEIWYTWSIKESINLTVSVGIRHTDGEWLGFNYNTIRRGDTKLTLDQDTITPSVTYDVFPIGILMPAWSGGNFNNKFCTSVNLVGSFSSTPNTLRIGYDDHNTYTTYNFRSYNLQQHNILSRVGYFRSRSWYILQEVSDNAAPQPINVAAIEFNITGATINKSVTT